MSGKTKSRKLVPQEIPLTADQVAARERMLASPCPYCSDPKTFQRELTDEGRLSHTGGIAPVGKFWARDESGGGGGPGGMVLAPTYDHGGYWRIPIGGEHFIPRFKDFSLEIVNFKAPYSSNLWATNVLLFVLSAAPGDLARHNRFPFSVARLTHKKSPVVIDAHTWFSHGSILTIHHLPRKLSSSDVTVMREALEFFRPETRGAPKVDKAGLIKALLDEGSEATQKSVAERIGVTDRTIRDWLAREGVTWDELKEQAVLTEFLDFAASLDLEEEKL